MACVKLGRHGHRVVPLDHLAMVLDIDQAEADRTAADLLRFNMARGVRSSELTPFGAMIASVRLERGRWRWFPRPSDNPPEPDPPGVETG